jgi:hypothetical protein
VATDIVEMRLREATYGTTWVTGSVPTGRDRPDGGGGPLAGGAADGDRRAGGCGPRWKPRRRRGTWGRWPEALVVGGRGGIL